MQGWALEVGILIKEQINAASLIITCVRILLGLIEAGSVLLSTFPQPLMLCIDISYGSVDEVKLNPLGFIHV